MPACGTSAVESRPPRSAGPMPNSISAARLLWRQARVSRGWASRAHTQACTRRRCRPMPRNRRYAASLGLTKLQSHRLWSPRMNSPAARTRKPENGWRRSSHTIGRVARRATGRRFWRRSKASSAQCVRTMWPWSRTCIACCIRMRPSDRWRSRRRIRSRDGAVPTARRLSLSTPAATSRWHRRRRTGATSVMRPESSAARRSPAGATSRASISSSRRTERCWATPDIWRSPRPSTSSRTRRMRQADASRTMRRRRSSPSTKMFCSCRRHRITTSVIG